MVMMIMVKCMVMMSHEFSSVISVILLASYKQRIHVYICL